MKKFLFGLALLASASLALAQPAPAQPPSVVVPDPIVGMIATVFASGVAVYKIVDGFKNYFPNLNGTILKVISAVGNFLVVGGGCVVVGHVNEIGGVVGCLVSAVCASLISAGFYQAKKASDIARAGGAAALVNTKAVAEVSAPAPKAP